MREMRWCEDTRVGDAELMYVDFVEPGVRYTWPEICALDQEPEVVRFPVAERYDRGMGDN